MQTNTAIQEKADPSAWISQIIDLEGNPNGYLDSNGKIRTGIYRNMPNAVYHGVEGTSSSLVKLLIKQSPAHVKEAYFSGKKRDVTHVQQKTFEIGSLAHEIVLEPSTFYERFYCLPNKADYCQLTLPELKVLCEQNKLKISGTKGELCLRLTEAKIGEYVTYEQAIEEIILDEHKLAFVEKIKLWQKQKGDRRNLADAMKDDETMGWSTRWPVDYKVWQEVHDMRDKVAKEMLFPVLLSDEGESELSVFAICPNTGMLLKCRFDRISYARDSTDLKTCQSVREFDFRKDCRNLAYDIQDAFYTYVSGLAGIELNSFLFLAVEKGTLNLTQIFELSEGTKNRANHKMHIGLKQLAQCLEKDYWPAYQDKLNIVTLDY
jgi:exodeoxyribonuclease VIII